MTDVKHEMPEDLRELYAAVNNTTAYQTAHPEVAIKADGRVAFKVRELIERIVQLTAERDAALRDLDETTKMLKIESEAAREARAELSRLKAPVRFGEVLHYREDPNIHDDSTRIAHARATMVQNVIANRSNPPEEKAG